MSIGYGTNVVIWMMVLVSLFLLVPVSPVVAGIMMILTSIVFIHNLSVIHRRRSQVVH